jgi:ubiquinone/menaquinone biosynthesis C-methylase UbiE
VYRSYDIVAPFYDRLAKVVFGDEILRAQRFLLESIRPGSEILIVGGGTGQLLEDICKQYRSGLRIHYIELSEKMLALSRKRYTAQNELYFVNAAVQQVRLDCMFDVIITPFLFDNFSAGTCRFVFEKLNEALKPKGVWLYADFKIKKEKEWWQKPLLSLMYIFFKVWCGIEANRLHETDSIFTQHNFKVLRSKTFYHDFILSAVYCRD